MTFRMFVIMAAAGLCAFIVTLAAPPSVKPALAWTANSGRGCASYTSNGVRNCIQNPHLSVDQGKPRSKKPPQH